MYTGVLREPTVAGAAPQRSDRTRQRPAGVPAPYPRPPAATAASPGESDVGSFQDYLPLSTLTSGIA